MISAHLQMVPPTITGQQKGVRCVGRRPIFYKKKEVALAEALFDEALEPLVPVEPLDGAVILATWWFFPWRESDRKLAEKMPFMLKDTYPDTDNLLKIFKDRLEKVGMVANDSRIAGEQTFKFWGSQPGVAFRIAPFETFETCLQVFSTADPFWFLAEWEKLEPPTERSA